MERAPFAETVLQRAVVDAALAIARERGGWDAVRMQDIAQAVGLPLRELLQRFADRDAVGDAFFDRADAALLAVGDDPQWAQRAVCDRLHAAICAWLDALAADRASVRGMFAYKLHPEHLHLQARGAMRISRTVQAIREVALLRATGLRREAEEAALTSIYLAAVCSWLVDGSPHSQRTRDSLARMLALAHRVGGWSG